MPFDWERALAAGYTLDDISSYLFGPNRKKIQNAPQSPLQAQGEPGQFGSADRAMDEPLRLDTGRINREWGRQSVAAPPSFGSPQPFVGPQPPADQEWTTSMGRVPQQYTGGQPISGTTLPAMTKTK